MALKRLFILIVFSIFFILLAGVSASELNIETLRSQAEDLVLKQGEMGWNSWVLGQPSNQALLYNMYPDLFTAESIATAKAVLEAAETAESKKQRTFFRNYLEAEYLYKQTALLWDIYSDLESQLMILVDGQMVPYREIDRYISNAKSPEERAVIAKEEYRIYKLLNNVILKRELDMAHRIVKDLGYKDYLELAVSYKNFDLDSLLKVCKGFLADSKDQYLALFDEVSSIPRDKFRRSDILYLLGAKDWDTYFPKEKMVGSLKSTIKGMGFNVDKQKNLLMHTQALEKINPRAVCFAMKVPEDVRISIKPRGGKSDYSALFHEMGHAEHFANSKTPIWEFQQLGSNAVTEGYAYLFEGLVENPVWLKENTSLSGEELQNYIKHSVFSNLYMMRRYMSKLIYEVSLHQGDTDPQKLYQTLMSEGYGFQLTEEEALRYLSDVDPLLYSADYVQAFFLQAMLEKTLTDRYGIKWWKSKKAGYFLRELFAKGNSFSGQEFAEKLGYSGLSADILKEKITVGLSQAD